MERGISRNPSAVPEFTFIRVIREIREIREIRG